MTHIEQVLKDAWMEGFEAGRDYPAVTDLSPDYLFEKYMDEVAEELETEKGEEHMKCIVKDCKNHSHQGEFVGNLCVPCHEFITKGKGRHSQAYRNTQREWVGLTEEDLKDAILDDQIGGSALISMMRGEVMVADIRNAINRIAKAIEAKLKEKNT